MNGSMALKTRDGYSDASLTNINNPLKPKRHLKGSKVSTSPIPLPTQSITTSSPLTPSSRPKKVVTGSQTSQIAAGDRLARTTSKVSTSKNIVTFSSQSDKLKKQKLSQTNSGTSSMGRPITEQVPAANGLDETELPSKKRKKKTQAATISRDAQASSIAADVDKIVKHSKTPTSNKHKRRKTKATPEVDESENAIGSKPKTRSQESEEPTKTEDLSEDALERHFAWSNEQRNRLRGTKVPKRVTQEGRFNMHRAINQTKITGLRKRGELTEDEVVILEDLINDFMMLNDLSIAQVQTLITPGAVGKQVKSFWRMVDEALPLRAPRHDHLVKQVRARAYDGQRGTLDDFEISELKEMIENEPSLPFMEFAEALNRHVSIVRDYYHSHLKHLHQPGAKGSQQMNSAFGPWTEPEDTRLKESVVEQIRALKREELGIDALNIETIEVTESDMINPKYHINPTTLATAVGTRGSYPTREHWKRIQWELNRDHQRTAAKIKYGNLHDTELQAISNHYTMLPADRYACLKGMLAYIREEAPQKIMRYQPSRARKVEKYIPNDWSQADCHEVLHRTEIDYPRGEYSNRDAYLVKILAMYEQQYSPFELTTFYSGPPEVCLNKFVQIRKYRWENESGERSMGLTKEAAENYVAEHGMVDRPKNWSFEVLSGLVDVRHIHTADGYRKEPASGKRQRPKSSYFVTVSDDESGDEEVVVGRVGDDEISSTEESGSASSSSEESESDDDEESD